MSPRPITHVGITTREGAEVSGILENLIACLLHSKKSVYISDTVENKLGKVPDSTQKLSECPKLDLLIVLGGDGSILGAVRELSDLHTYLFGINAGTLGFLSEVPPDNLENTCLAIWDEHYTLDERMLLKVVLTKKNGGSQEYRALNELVVSQDSGSRLVEIPTEIDGIEIATFRADGLIVATPTGSTAYNLSAGGPILHPHLNAMILTPVAPFSFSQKPLVIPAEKSVTLKMNRENQEKMIMILDGQVEEHLEYGDTITISRHPETAKFLRLPQENYFKTLREKLKWGERL